ncbi:predicted protein, partial [Nematostella vectensis]
VTQETLSGAGLRGITLRPYQLEGVGWMRDCALTGHGCILGDEMGLGKTIQTISVLLLLKRTIKHTGLFLVLSPLSVMANWKNEIKRFTKSLKVLSLIGSKEEREITKNKLFQDIKNIDVLLTSYEICLRETSFLQRFHWSAVAVDEAHRLKNSQSLLYTELIQFKYDFSILLTGTPVQNNLKELYSLLSFIAPSIFDLEYVEEFETAFKNLATGRDNTNSDLPQLLSPFLLRRVKSEVMVDLPEKSEVILYAGMSELQKKYYKAILMKDYDIFSTDGPSRNKLNSILTNLRKCVNHPYLFDGVEPEPFALGEHLITASGKLHAIDQLLSYLYKRGHKVLMFSQMTRMLDIVQDYLGYRGYAYERLDGSVRGEERYIAIKNFNEEQDNFIFLLSTKAGGQGLNLMSADTVIFVDSDYNPQNDLQAAARAHRIGQTRPVKIIRLVGRNTVEEIILKHADDKMRLTNNVIEGGQVYDSSKIVASYRTLLLANILKFGLEKLFESEERYVIYLILGASRNGRWIVEDKTPKPDLETLSTNQELQGTVNHFTSMYVYEGRDYSKGASDEDVAAFDKMVADVLDEVQKAERTLRSDKCPTASVLGDLTSKKRKVLTPEELEQRRIKRQEAAAKRAKLKEEAEERREQERMKKLEKLWRDNGYTSKRVNRDDNTDEESGSDEDSVTSEGEDSNCRDIQYVRGDVTRPINTRGNEAVIVHCVDDYGFWGQGGLFSAISRRSCKPQEEYELAGQMKDLHLGDVHLIELDDSSTGQDAKHSVALVVAQTRDRQHRLKPVDLRALGTGLLSVALEAKRRKASVHLPRIGHSTPGFNWYGTERLIRKHLASRGVLTSMYPFITCFPPHSPPNPRL